MGNRRHADAWIPRQQLQGFRQPSSGERVLRAQLLPDADNPAIHHLVNRRDKAHAGSRIRGPSASNSPQTCLSMKSRLPPFVLKISKTRRSALLSLVLIGSLALLRPPSCGPRPSSLASCAVWPSWISCGRGHPWAALGQNDTSARIAAPAATDSTWGRRITESTAPENGIARRRGSL